jgi:hypothetical protein
MARKIKRPPIAWDSRKDKELKFIWGLYVKGKPIKNVVAYNVEEHWYIFLGVDGLKHMVHCDNFCVRRLS